MTKRGIVYILGAGASANALPVVSEMIERLKIFYLALFLSVLNKSKPEERKNTEKLIAELKDLLLKLEDKRSIDTYAKELYIKKDTEKLNTLKAILGTYLTFEEMFSDTEIRAFLESQFPHLIDHASLNAEKGGTGVLNSINTELKNKLGQPGNVGPEYINELDCLKYLYKYKGTNQEFQNSKTRIDPRYINFLVDTMEKIDSFPSNIKFFSWNYDSQFLHAEKNLNFTITSKGEIADYPFLKRLNGIAARKEINPATISTNMTTEEKILKCSDCFWRLNHPEKIGENLLVKFAFEQNEDLKNLDISSHVDDFDSISDLIIIGYSFPLANRNIDKKVFQTILNKVNYTREKIINLSIHVQAPPGSDANHDQFIISKAKITGIINSIIPELELSSDGNELTYTIKVPTPSWITTDVAVPGGAFVRPPETTETLKIKFYRQWDPVNFYIPQSF